MSEGPQTHLPPHRRPAPGDLELVRSFVNTLDLEDGTDAVASAEALERWLRERGVLGGGERVDEADLRRALGVREALRSLMLANNGAPLDADAPATLNAVAERAEVVVRFDAAGEPALVPARGGAHRALARMLAAVARGRADGTWERMKACPDPSCHWAFYDYSKNRSGHWCSMAICGNRNKARAYRERRRRGDG